MPARQILARTNPPTVWLLNCTHCALLNDSISFHYYLVGSAVQILFCQSLLKSAIVLCLGRPWQPLANSVVRVSAWCRHAEGVGMQRLGWSLELGMGMPWWGVLQSSEKVNLSAMVCLGKAQVAKVCRRLLKVAQVCQRLLSKLWQTEANLRKLAVSAMVCLGKAQVAKVCRSLLKGARVCQRLLSNIWQT